MEQLEAFFSGLKATIDETRKVRKQYDPLLAFDFNSLEFYWPMETKTSEILAFFLNPGKPHGQNRLFLEIFLKMYNIQKGLDLIKKVNTKEKWTEYSFKTKEKKIRFIDILITFGNKDFGLAIENKSHGAEDQDNQVSDYCEYLGKEFKDYMLIYAPIDDTEPDEKSITNIERETLTEEGKYKKIEFRNNLIDCIHEWSIRCQAERVRSFLMDFENYIRKTILNEPLMDEKNNIVDYALKSAENTEAAFEVAGSIELVKTKLFERFREQISNLKIINPKTQSLVKIKIDECFHDKEYGFGFYIDNWDNYYICFNFDSINQKDFCYGIHKMEGSEVLITEELYKELSNSVEKGEYTGEWVWYKDFEDYYKNWDVNTYIEIQNGKLALKIKEITELILKNTQEIIGL